ncbi:MAG: hypothetical protein J6I97_01485, partial [Agathobacter sp.]|nr:hypothetical protein [Agathobacter sp.]
KKMIKQIRPGLVITYTIKPNIYGGMICRWMKIPYATNITGLGTTFQNDGLLKKIVVFRKLGFSVAEIKDFLEEKVPLQELLEKNIHELQEKMNELNGAIKICKKMQSRQEDLDSFNENFYWDEIKEQEQKGNKFLEIVNDSIGYEKQIFYRYFELLDEDGNVRYGKEEIIQKVLKTFLLGAISYYVFLGVFSGEWGVNRLLQGLLYPFIILGIWSLFGLPWYFVKKKYPKASTIAKKVIYGIVIGIPVVVSFVILAFAIFQQ